MPPDFSDTFGNFLKGADIPAGKEFELTIAGAGVQEFNAMGAATGQNKQRKLVLSFRESIKLLVCNATNARTIADAYGSNTDNLAGKKIALSRTTTNMGPGILVRVPAQPAASVAGDPFAAGSQGNGAQQQPQQSRRTVLVDPPPADAPNNPPGDPDFDDPLPF